MPRQVSDEEYGWLTQQANTVRFIESIYNDPALKPEAQALIKKKYPNINIPEHEVESRFRAEIEALRDERRKEKEEEAERQAQAKTKEFDDIRARTQKQYGFTDDAMTRLEKMMIERNIGNYDDAATLMAMKEPKLSDGGHHADGFWHHDQVPGFKDIAKDPEGWGRSEILKSLYADQERSKQQRF